MALERRFGRPGGPCWRWNGALVAPGGVELALERRFGRPGGAKLALDRRFRRPTGSK